MFNKNKNVRQHTIFKLINYLFIIVFWDVVRTSEMSVDNHFTRQYIPEDNSEHQTRRRENLKSHIINYLINSVTVYMFWPFGHLQVH
jgi:hypothetical protein